MICSSRVCPFVVGVYTAMLVLALDTASGIGQDTSLLELARRAAEGDTQAYHSVLRQYGKYQELVAAKRIPIEYAEVLDNRVWSDCMDACNEMKRPAERFASERRNIDRFLKSFHLLTPVASDEPPAVTEQPQPPKQLLTLCDIEACYGSLGPVRQSPAYYPYDSIEFRAGVEGATGDDDGKAKISWIIELIGPDGKKVVEDKGEGRTGLARYNNRLPFFVTLPLPAEPPPGDYTFRVIVRDDLAERETSFEQPIEIRPAEFAIVSPHFFYDEEGKAPARAGGTVGQVLFVRLQCIGFDKSSGRIETAMSIQLLDEKERPVLPKAVEAVVREDKADVVKEADVVTFSGHIPLEVAGKFTLRVVLQDLVGNNLATYTAPIEVTPISR